MPSHVALLVAIVSARNNQSCLYDQAKYNLTKKILQVIKWKYFFSPNEQPKIFTGSNLVFISGKFVIENLEQCVTVMYASIIDNNPGHKFDTINIPPCIPYCMFSMVVNRKPKELREFIYFGIKCTEYNSVTSNSGNYSSTTPSAQSIIDIIADDIESKPNQVLKVVDPMIPSVNYNAAATSGSSENLINPDMQIDSSCKRNQKQSSNYVNLDAQNEEEKQSDYDDNEKDTELDEEEK
ncbi:15438_t:CDS:2, partial [Gigaspora margarita]